MMRTGRILSTLIHKELQHDRGYYLVAMVLLIYVPVLKSLYYLGQGGSLALDWGRQLNYMLNFNQLIMRNPPVFNETMHILGIMAAILLGSILLGEERKGSLTYLVTTPVARRDILLSKFLVGTAALLLAMGIIVVFITSMAGPLGIELYPAVLMRWALVMSLGWICIFTLALLTSTFTAAVIPAAVVSFILIYLPRTFVALMENIAARYFNAPEAFSIKAQYLGKYFTITDYMNGEHWNIITSVQHFPDWRMVGVMGTNGPAPPLQQECMLLLLGIVVLLGFAIFVFNRISLDEQRTFFANARTRQGFIVLSGLMAGYILFFPLCETLTIYLIGQTGMILAFYGFVEWLPQRLGGIYRPKRVITDSSRQRPGM